MDQACVALLELGRALQDSGYHFITPTPETHRRVFGRRALAQDARDVFGWSRPFLRELLPPAWFELLRAAGALREQFGQYVSDVRYSSLGERLFVHSAYPTLDAQAVFFGPDTYRFCAFLERTLRDVRASRVVDIGCGSGAGGLVAARACGAARVQLVDINTRALAFAEINALLFAGRAAVTVAESDVLAGVTGEADVIVANPPYMRDPSARVYRDGGGAFGEALSVRIAREALARLPVSGSLLLYTGAAIVEGEDVFFSAVRSLLVGHAYDYVELDPDVFGEELALPGYERVERIAAVGLVVTKAG